MLAPTQRLYEDDEVGRDDAKTEPLKALLLVWEPDAEGKYSHAPVSLGARAYLTHLQVAFRIKQGETKVGKQPGVNKLVLKSPNVSRQQ